MLSVVIPVFNRAKQVLLAIDSIIVQRDLDDDVEIVIVDDGSSVPVDVGDRQVKVIALPKNCGPAAARNAGIRASRGEHIVLLDSDDVWLPNKLAFQSRFFREVARGRNAALNATACGFYYHNRWTRKLELRHPRAAGSLADFVGGCWFAPGSTLFLHREAFELVGGFDENLRRLEDLDWFIRFGRAGGSLHVMPMAGAVIFPSRSQTYDVLCDSLSELAWKYGPEGPFALSAPDWRRFRAYGFLEAGLAALMSGHPIVGASHLAQSLALVPRSRPGLSRNWRRTFDVPGAIDSLYGTMARCAQDQAALRRGGRGA